MASIHRYLAVGVESQLVREWFEALEPAPEYIAFERGHLFHFREVGDLVLDDLGRVDGHASPTVSLFEPGVRRGLFTTAGEVHFLTIRLERTFPQLAHIRNDFRRWLRQFDLVFDGRSGPFDYYLEGSLRNHDTPILAMPLASAALRAGAYFVSEEDNDRVLDDLCKRVALRGALCTEDLAAGDIPGR